MNEHDTAKPWMPGIKNFPFLGPVGVMLPSWYNETRTHLSLHKDAPIPRTIQTVGRTLAMPVLGGLHHQYFRA
jgi:hypothetical protein